MFALTVSMVVYIDVETTCNLIVSLYYCRE